MESTEEPDVCPKCTTTLQLKGRWLHCPNCGYQVAPQDETASLLAVRPDKTKGQAG